MNPATFYFIAHFGWSPSTWPHIEGATASFAGACPVPNWVNYCRARWEGEL